MMYDLDTLQAGKGAFVFVCIGCAMYLTIIVYEAILYSY
jgi:hypothetical protein